jgi:hypothetical protein
MSGGGKGTKSWFGKVSKMIGSLTGDPAHGWMAQKAVGLYQAKEEKDRAKRAKFNDYQREMRAAGREAQESFEEWQKQQELDAKKAEEEQRKQNIHRAGVGSAGGMLTPQERLLETYRPGGAAKRLLGY